MENPHLMETGWVHKAREDGKFDIITVNGERHTLVICQMPQSPSQGPAVTQLTMSALERWRGREFGRASILEVLEKAQGITFRLDDQTHWFNQSKTQVILHPSQVIEVVDTAGKRYGVARPGKLSNHRVDGFRQWKLHLRMISERLMGEDVMARFPIRVDPLWATYESEQMPQPVGSQTPLDEFDWAYDADVSQDLEQHLA